LWVPVSRVQLVGDMLPSPLIPSLLATFSDRSRMYAVMGCILVTDLSTLVDSKPLIEHQDGERIVQFHTAAVALAIQHLHRQEIVCRMCSLDSIMLDSKGYPQLLDFTLSKKLTDCGGRTFTLCGIAEYNSPEQVQKTGHGMSPDWWALGILTYEMLFAATPFAPASTGSALPEAELKPAPEVTAKSGGGKATEARRMSIARLLVTTGGGELESTVATYKSIIAYASASEPQLEYPSSRTEPSKVLQMPLASKFIARYSGCVLT